MSYIDTAFASTNQFGGVDYTPHNKGVTPVFFIESVIDHAASEKAGRAIYVDMERVRIHIAGDSLSAATHPVDAGIIARFQEAYDRWKSKGRVLVSGTPLAKWPLATPSFIKEMEFLNIFSVEDLSSVADVNLDRMADGRQWRDKATAWLKSAKDGAAAMMYAAENARLRADIERLSNQVAALDAAIPEKAVKRARQVIKKHIVSLEERERRSLRMKAWQAARKARASK